MFRLFSDAACWTLGVVFRCHPTTEYLHIVGPVGLHIDVSQASDCVDSKLDSVCAAVSFQHLGLLWPFLFPFSCAEVLGPVNFACLCFPQRIPEL